MMKWLVGTLALTGCAFALGCGAGEGSSEGLVRLLVRCRPFQNPPPPEEIQEAEDGFRALRSTVPVIERFEWGRIDDNRSRDTHFLLLTFKDRQSLEASREYGEALAQAAGRNWHVIPTTAYVVHDATPRARTATRGHLRRMVQFSLKKGNASEEIQKVENAMAALPSKIPAIERLEWGTEISPPPPPTEHFNPTGHHLHLLLTFENVSARDACIAHPAYKEFQGLLKQYAGKPFEQEYVARGARD